LILLGTPGLFGTTDKVGQSGVIHQSGIRRHYLIDHRLLADDLNRGVGQQPNN
jgi:hypothetical protein